MASIIERKVEATKTNYFWYLNTFGDENIFNKNSSTFLFKLL